MNVVLEVTTGIVLKNANCRSALPTTSPKELAFMFMHLTIAALRHFLHRTAGYDIGGIH